MLSEPPSRIQQPAGVGGSQPRKESFDCSLKAILAVLRIIMRGEPEKTGGEPPVSLIEW
jgi:hypothetical protein